MPDQKIITDMLWSLLKVKNVKAEPLPLVLQIRSRNIVESKQNTTGSSTALSTDEKNKALLSKTRSRNVKQVQNENQRRPACQCRS